MLIRAFSGLRGHRLHRQSPARTLQPQTPLSPNPLPYQMPEKETGSMLKLHPQVRSRKNPYPNPPESPPGEAPLKQKMRLHRITLQPRPMESQRQRLHHHPILPLPSPRALHHRIRIPTTSQLKHPPQFRKKSCRAFRSMPLRTLRNRQTKWRQAHRNPWPRHRTSP